jgi:di/tricarboxylate transporter
MAIEMIVVLALVFVAVVLFATERLPVDLVALLLMATLLLSRLVTPEEGLSGFSNTATVTVGAMFVLSAGLFRTGAVKVMGKLMSRLLATNFWVGLISLMVVAAALSAFMNNTPVVAIFIPIALGAAAKLRASPSRLLMPLSFASMFGGVCTLIGTSTNILVSTIAERRGLPAFSLFEFAPLGLIFFLAGTAYMVLVGVRLIPERRTTADLNQSYGMGEYLTEIELQPEAKSVGTRLGSSPLEEELEIEVLELVRGDRRTILPRRGTLLHAGDILRVRCSVKLIRELQERTGIRLVQSKKDSTSQPQEPSAMDEEGDEALLVEAVVAPHSSLEGKSLKQLFFRDRFGATALAIRSHGAVLHEKTDEARLHAGDTLLLEIRRSDLPKLQEHPAFLIVSEVGLPTFRKQKMLPAMAILVGVVAVAAAGLLPIVVSAVAGAVLMVLLGCITLEEAYQAVDWKVIFLLAGILTLGVALEKSGAALLLANLLTGWMGNWGPYALVAVFYLLTSLLTEAMSNNATAALLAPIAIATAESLGISARPLLMAVTFAASSSFLTPVGYQTNAMIYGPGQFRFADFVRVGAPLNVLFWVLATILIPRFWPF